MTTTLILDTESNGRERCHGFADELSQKSALQLFKLSNPQWAGFREIVPVPTEMDSSDARGWTYCNQLQHNSLQNIATLCNTTHCNTLQHTATHCNTLQHTATQTIMHTKICLNLCQRNWIFQIRNV